MNKFYLNLHFCNLSFIANARSSPVGGITITFCNFLVSARRSAWYKSWAYSLLLVGEANLIAPGGVGVFESAIKPSPGLAVIERKTFAKGA